jgi:hypothetical protein
MFLTMGKLQLTRQTLGRVFNFRSGNAQATSLTLLLSKTAQLKVDNSAQKSWFSLASHHGLPFSSKLNQVIWRYDNRHESIKQNGTRHKI